MVFGLFKTVLLQHQSAGLALARLRSIALHSHWGGLKAKIGPNLMSVWGITLMSPLQPSSREPGRKHAELREDNKQGIDRTRTKCTAKLVPAR